MPTISIIVPVYNVEKELPGCMDSIFAQTFQDFEIILVDNESTDSGAGLCRKYAAADDRVRFIQVKSRCENGERLNGISEVRNAGVAAAKGDYIAFVDSDDYIREDMFEVLLDAMQKTGADIVKSDYIMVTGETAPEIHDEAEEEIAIYNSLEAIDVMLTQKFSDTIHIKCVLWDGLYKRKVFYEGDEPAVIFPVGKVNEDTWVCPEILLRAEKIAHINRAMYCYYRRPGSIMNSKMNLSQINSRDLWQHVEEVVSPYTDKYAAVFARKRVTRYLGLMQRVYRSKYRAEWFDKIRRELIADRKRLLSVLQDIRLKVLLCSVDWWFGYRVVKKLIGKRK